MLYQGSWFLLFSVLICAVQSAQKQIVLNKVDNCTKLYNFFEMRKELRWFFTEPDYNCAQELASCPQCLLRRSNPINNVPLQSCTCFKTCFNLEKLREKESSKFVDYLEVKIRGGSGGNGCCSFLSDHRKEFAGPDGANGGNGGHVIFEATTNKKSLSHLSSSIRGNDGAPGRNKKMLGANAKHIKIHVPVGTLIKEKDKICADLSTAGEKYIACRGGVGGLGNLEFVSSTNNAPEESTKGSVGEQRILSLELKSIADIGLIGFPNAGKSSLLRAISNAKPLVAAYPFTTLNPHIGVVEYADSSQVFVADIPGLIKGAHRNEGLGHAFLRHIQRCHTLLYVLDLDSSEKHQLSILRRELELFDEALSKVPFMVIGNKIDLPGAVQKISDLQMLNKIDILPVSALLKINIEELKWKLKEIKNSS